MSSTVSRFKVDLKNWWNTPGLFSEYDLNLSDYGIEQRFDNALKLQNYECIYKDYINGVCQIRSKITGEIKEISIEKLININNNDTVIPDSEDMRLIYSDNFYSKMYN